MARGEEGMRRGGREREDGVEGKRRKDKAVRQSPLREGEGGREEGLEDTAAMKPVICQISHGRARIHIMSLNGERTMSNKAGAEAACLTKLLP